MTSVTIDRLDGLSSSAAVKGPCRLATTGPITLSGLPVIDGVQTLPNDRICVKDQPVRSENGIWIADTGPWRRAADFSRARDVVKGTIVYITDGTENAGFDYIVDSSDPVEIGVSDIIFVHPPNYIDSAAIALSSAAVAKRIAAFTVAARDVPIHADFLAMSLIEIAAYTHIMTRGYFVPGDGGGVEWIKLTSTPSSPDPYYHVQVAGFWWRMNTMYPTTKMFGIINTGDEGARLQSAISYACTYSGGNLNVFPGTISYGSSLTAPAGLHMWGVDRNKCNLNYTANAGDGLVIDTGQASSIKGILFSGPQVTATSGALIKVIATGAAFGVGYGIVENCEFSYGWNQLDLAACFSWTVRNNIFLRFKNNGLLLHNENSTQLGRCQVYGNEFTCVSYADNGIGIYHTQGSQTKIWGNTFFQCFVAIYRNMDVGAGFWMNDNHTWGNHIQGCYYGILRTLTSGVFMADEVDFGNIIFAHFGIADNQADDSAASWLNNWMGQNQIFLYLPNAIGFNCKINNFEYGSGTIDGADSGSIPIAGGIGIFVKRGGFNWRVRDQAWSVIATRVATFETNNTCYIDGKNFLVADPVFIPATPHNGATPVIFVYTAGLSDEYISVRQGAGGSLGASVGIANIHTSDDPSGFSYHLRHGQTISLSYTNVTPSIWKQIGA